MSIKKLGKRARLKILFAGIAGLIVTKNTLSQEYVEVVNPYGETSDIDECDIHYEEWGYGSAAACRSAWNQSDQLAYNDRINAVAENSKGMLQQFFNTLTEQFKGMLEDTLGTINTIFSLVFTRNQTEMTEAYSKFGDSINKSKEVLEQTKLQRNAMVGPQTCEGAILGDTAMKAKAIAKQDSIDLAEKSIGIELKKTSISNPFDDIAYDLNYKYGAGAEKENGHLDLSLITSEINLDEEGTSQALDVVDALTVTGFDTPYVPTFINEDELNKSNRDARKQLDMHNQHFFFARHVLSKSVTRRAAISQERSLLGVMEVDINRTYGSKVWREELQGFASPVPLHEVCLTQQALNNHINNELVKIREDKVRLAALIALARMDSTQRKSEIFSKFNN